MSTLCCLFFMFCFFKQKTAYEMRISDWSSDVCSSDLKGLNPAAAERPAQPVGHRTRPSHRSAHPRKILPRRCPPEGGKPAFRPAARLTVKVSPRDRTRVV